MHGQTASSLPCFSYERRPPLFGLDHGERLTLGLTLADCGRVIATARQACPAFDDLEPQHQAIVFMDCWYGINERVLGERGKAGAVDWDKVFAFIERILPLILRIFGL